MDLRAEILFIILLLITQSGPKVGIQYILYSIAFSVYLRLAHSVLYCFTIHIIVFDGNLINSSVIKHN